MLEDGTYPPTVVLIISPRTPETPRFLQATTVCSRDRYPQNTSIVGRMQMDREASAAESTRDVVLPSANA